MKLLTLILCVLSFNLYGVDWQGHRGARGLYPENTISGMEEALKHPITTLEMDVVITKDKKIILSHEPWMNAEICLGPQGKKIQGKKYNIYKMNYDEVLKFDCGSLRNKGFPRQFLASTGKPTLEKVLSVIEEKYKDRKIHYNIEIKYTKEWEKQGFVPGFRTLSDETIKIIKKFLPESRYSIQSFNFDVLNHIRKTNPKVRLSALNTKSIAPEDLVQELGFMPEFYSPYFKNLTPSIVKAYKPLTIKLIPWTVNDVETMEELIKLGVDGIITDYPDLIEKVGQKKCKEGENLFEEKCVKIPVHGEASHNPPGWVCKKGHIQKRNRCIKIALPENATFLPDGKTWECNVGYERYRTICRKK